MLAMLEHALKKKRPAIFAGVGLRTDNIEETHVTVYYQREKKIGPLRFSSCPFCGVQFRKLTTQGKVNLKLGETKK